MTPTRCFPVDIKLKSFEKVIELKDKYVSAYYHLGMLNMNLNNKEEAIKNQKKIILSAPEAPTSSVVKNVFEYSKKQLIFRIEFISGAYGTDGKGWNQ